MTEYASHPYVEVEIRFKTADGGISVLTGLTSQAPILEEDWDRDEELYIFPHKIVHEPTFKEFRVSFPYPIGRDRAYYEILSGEAAKEHIRKNEF